MSRNISDLHPRLQLKIQELITECKKQGLIIGISECLRTVEEQEALYAKGRTTSGSIVTNSRGVSYSSMHQWGIAVDFYRADGIGAYVDTDGFFTKVGKIGKDIGLEWGGSWRSIKDKPHFQLADWGSTATKLKKLYGTPDKFKKTWIVTIPDEVLSEEILVTKRNIKIVQDWVGTAVDGAWGKKSKSCMIKKLQEIMNVKQTGQSSEKFRKNLPVKKENDDDLYVKCIEGLLFVQGYNPQDFSGKYTANVAECVRKLEKDRGLDEDKGITGKQVWQALIM